MKIKKFLVSNMSEALKKIRDELGPNALILDAKQVSRGPLYQLYGKKMLEVTAAIDEDKNKRVESTPISTEPLQELMQDLQEIKELLKYGFIERKYREVFFKLCDMGISKDVALKIAKKLTGDGDNNFAEIDLKERLVSLLPKTEPIKLPKNGTPNIVALIGPTGVGKTTTIAKLAAKFALLENIPVGLITIDNYRVAAVEQLRTFADIAGIPLEVVNEPQEFPEKVSRLRDKKIILIDTAGRSQRNGYHIAELANYFKLVQPNEVHLVLAANTESRTLESVTERFIPLGVNKFIFTKLDETESIGPMFSVLFEYPKPVSYLTFGQTVPDDIETADEVRLAELLMGERVPY